MKTILVLDDEVLVLNVLRHILANSGYAVLTATSAEQAFQRFEEMESHIDLLIADMKLPVSSGAQVAVELRSVRPRLKIMLVSGYPNSMWNHQGIAELPSESFLTLTKPFSVSNLLENIHQLIGPPEEQCGALGLPRRN